MQNEADVSPDVVIEPLSFKYLFPALKLVNSVFPRREQGWERADISFPISILPLGQFITRLAGYPMLKYWIARDRKTNQIYGTLGCYTRSDDPDAYWGGWMCVDPRQRGNIVGKKLYTVVVRQYRMKGDRAYFRMYTSTDPKEARARAIYERYGFKIYKEKFNPVTGYTILYYQAPFSEMGRSSLTSEDVRRSTE